MRLIVLAIAAALTAGCASRPAPPRQVAPDTKQSVNLSGYPPEFRQGYADGCASVNAAHRRDEARFKSDANYAMGWRDGNSICKPR